MDLSKRVQKFACRRAAAWFYQVFAASVSAGAKKTGLPRSTTIILLQLLI